MLLIHTSTREFIFAVKRNQLHVRAQIACENKVKCRIVYWNRFYSESVFKREMLCAGSDNSFKYYETDIDFSEPAQYVRYYFELDDGVKSTYWGRNGLEECEPDYCFEYLATAELDIVQIPEWAKGTVWYQIFPERFFNGNMHNDPADVQPWGAVPTRENHFGGDLRGIIEKIPYLQELGVDVVYLTPVFMSPSNHKYDTTDYFTIDPCFGTTQDLIGLVQQCHSKGMKVVLDGVFNHIGYSSPQFQDVVINGAKSRYADWFYIKEYPVKTEPVNYECVGYYKWMPKLRYKTRAVREYILNAAKYWIETADIDGWRLDVADEVDFTFWQEFRREIKSIYPETFLLAETWKDGRDMLRGDQMDSVMNYLFRDTAVDFFAKNKINEKIFRHRISGMLFGYSRPFRPVLYNAIGSHDTPRFLTECGADKRRFKLAVVFQMTFVGMPVIYYGDEIGMDGENDPDCRKTMEWDKPDDNLLWFYRGLVNLRKKLISLRYGSLRFLYCRDNVIAYSRKYGLETTYVVINNSGKSQTVSFSVLEDSADIADHEKDDAEHTIMQEQSLEMERTEFAKACDLEIYECCDMFTVKLEAFQFRMFTMDKMKQQLPERS